jgi:hypothetical protein
MKILFIILMIPFLVEAQHITKIEKVDLGLGVGLDYGGIGVRGTYYIEPHVGVFGSVGYAVSNSTVAKGMGYNVGGRLRLRPDSWFCVVAGGMYGYNGIIRDVMGSTIYYGPSAFIGIETHHRRTPIYVNAELIVPFRSNEYNRNVKTGDDPSPIGFSLGCHMVLVKRKKQ